MSEFQKLKINKRLKRNINGRLREYLAVTSPGFEDLCKQELIEAGFSKNKMELIKGGVCFQGKLIDCLNANLHTRIANRIIMRIDHFKATNFNSFEKKLSKIPWELFLPKHTELNIKVTSHNSRIYHKGAISNFIFESINNKIIVVNNKSKNEFNQTIFVRIIDDKVLISIDSTGEALYKRGLKKGFFRAPIRENTASALLSILKFDCNSPILDPMCGSGTFSLEAAMKIKQIPPGFIRNFAFMKWPSFKEKQWLFIKKNSLKQIKKFKSPMIYASDISKSSCKILKKRIINNGLGDAINVDTKNFFDISPNDLVPGTIIINPPYGIRMGNKKYSNKLFNDICFHIKKFKRWKVGIIVPPNHNKYQIPLTLSKKNIKSGGRNISFLFGLIK